MATVFRGGRWRALAVVGAAALLTGCTANGPAHAPAPVATSAPAVSGLVNVTRCNSYRATVEANTRALAVEEALRHTDAAEKIRAQITADLRAAATIPGCRISG